VVQNTTTEENNMNDIVIEQLRSLRLSPFANALELQRQQPTTFNELGFEERLTLLLDHELIERENARVTRLRRQAKFRLDAPPEKLNYSIERGLIKSEVAPLISGSYLQLKQNILITGKTGCGKTYLACALGEQGCRQQYRVRYYRLGRLLDALIAARVDGSYTQLMNQLSKVELLILDDWGLEKMNARQASELLEVIEDRYQVNSTIIASQVPVKEWYQLISNPTIADALLDRLIHNSHKIDLDGDSQRKNNLTLSDH
jgi:DNA replication protein DnaC